MITEKHFNVYGALYMLCIRWHSGQWSLGYRILCKLGQMGYKTGLTIRNNCFESPEQKEYYRKFFRKLRNKL